MTHVISPKLTGRQRNFIIGTILGGSSVSKPPKGKNCYLAMRSKDLDWLRFKATELQPLASDTPLTIEKTNRWHSMCYPLFNEFRDMFYKNNERHISSDTLNSLRDVALAIWYRDSGIYTKDRVVINTHIWKEDGTQKIEEYFNLLGYNPCVFKERGNFRIKLDPTSSMEFLRLIAVHLPQ